MGQDLIDISIIAARVDNLDLINKLIVSSKSHWQWPKEYLKRALPLHRITPEYMLQNSCFEIVTSAKETIAFFSIELDGSSVLLDNLWVSPTKIGFGIGKQACDHIVSLSRAKKMKKIVVLPDPPSEQFYVKMGFMITGEKVKSRILNGPIYTIHQMILEY